MARGRKSAEQLENEQKARADLLVISKSKIKKILFLLLILVLILVIGMVSLKYKKTRDDNRKAQDEIKRLSDPTVSVQNAEDKIIADVKKVALVPEDERPQILNVTDAESLISQPLFALIKNDDKVLLYPKSRRQIVYRPSTGQIITAVTLPESAANPAPNSTTPTN